MIKLYGTPAEITAQIKILVKLFGKNATLTEIKNCVWWWLE